MKRFLIARSIERQVSKLKSTSSVREDIGLGDGFAVRIYPSGKKSYTTRYRFPPGSNPKTFIHHPDAGALSAEDALEAHQYVKKMVREGKDPLALVNQAAQLERISLTVDEVWKSYKESSNTRESTLKDYDNRYNRWIKPILGNCKAKDVTGRQCSELISHIKTNSGAVKGGHKTASVCLTLIRNIFKEAYLLNQIEITENPTAGLTLDIMRIKKSAPKSRTLEPVDLVKVWSTIDENVNAGKCLPSTGAAIKIAILTGLRRQEVVSMRYSHIKFNADGSADYIIPETLMKGKRTHVVVLSRTAVEIILKIKNLESDFVFNSRIGRLGGYKPISANAMNSIIGKILGLTKIKQPKHLRVEMELFTPHDLRRSFATGLSKHLKASHDIIHKMIAHGNDDKLEQRIDKVLDATYITYKQQAVQRILWNEWSELIEKTLKETKDAPRDS